MNLQGEWRIIRQCEEKVRVEDSRSGCMIFISSSQLFSSDSGMVNLVLPGMGFFQVNMIGERDKGAEDIWEGMLIMVDLGI